MSATRGDDARGDGPALGAFVGLVPALVADADGTGVLQVLVDRCAERFGPVHVGIVVGDSGGSLAALAGSDTGARREEERQLETGEGPCVDAAQDGVAVVVDDLGADADRWPRWTARALCDGLRSAYCYPMRLDGTTIGSFNLLGDRVNLLDRTAVRDCAVLADVAAAVLLVQRRPTGLADVGAELQTALDRRAAVEQAKGVVAGALGVPVPEASTVLRTWCRATGRRLAEVAADVNAGHLVPDRLTHPPHLPG